jgi:hypothetical protein
MREERPPQRSLPRPISARRAGKKEARAQARRAARRVDLKQAIHASKRELEARNLFRPLAEKDLAADRFGHAS